MSVMDYQGVELISNRDIDLFLSPNSTKRLLKGIYSHFNQGISTTYLLRTFNQQIFFLLLIKYWQGTFRTASAVACRQPFALASSDPTWPDLSDRAPARESAPPLPWNILWKVAQKKIKNCSTTCPLCILPPDSAQKHSNWLMSSFLPYFVLVLEWPVEMSARSVVCLAGRSNTSAVDIVHYFISLKKASFLLLDTRWQ